MTRDSSSLDCIHKMYLRFLWLIVTFKGKRPSSALQAILESLEAILEAYKIEGVGGIKDKRVKGKTS